ncbi:hypothetical protein JCM17092_03820 [Haloplanus litoreus]
MDGTTADPVTDGVTITTANSTNAEYVSTTQDGELTLDLSASNPALRGNGVNPGARTSISDAFRLRYDGDTAATVWLTSDAEGITFSVGGVGADSATNTVTLTPDESVPVGFVVDTTGEAPPPTATFTVHARTADDGGAPERAAGAASADPAEPVTTRVTSPDAATRTLTLRNTAAGRSLTLDLNRLVVARAGDGVVTLDELSVVSDGGAVDLDVAVTAPNATGALPTDASVRPLGAVRIEERRGAVERATLRFAVDRAYLDATGLSAEELTVYRYDGAEWSERGVEVVATREDRIVLEAETPGFSTFVVAAKVPDLRITAADLRRGTVTPDERATVTAEVTNAGATTGSQTVTLTLDGDPVAERRVELAPGASRNVTFEVRAPGSGTYDLRLGATDVGRLVVEGPAPPSEDGDPRPTPNDGGTTRTPPDTASSVEPPADRTAAPVAEPAAGDLTETVWLVGGLVGVLVILALARRVRE